ncbi:MAG: hypothetical protein Q7T63_05000, partial [Burkholderiaceae bacterium]|nr:hypothetical protein [Burkholderiaceae bacterium]
MASNSFIAFISTKKMGLRPQRVSAPTYGNRLAPQTGRVCGQGLRELGLDLFDDARESGLVVNGD